MRKSTKELLMQVENKFHFTPMNMNEGYQYLETQLKCFSPSDKPYVLSAVFVMMNAVVNAVRESEE